MFARTNSIINCLFIVLVSVCSHSSFALEPLDKDEGYILIAIYIESGYLPTKVTLEGSGWGNDITVKNFKGHENYRLLPVEAGTYKFSRLYLDKRNYFDLEDREFVINVVPGNIKYAGDLSVQTGMNSGFSGSILDGAAFFFNNKSSLALNYLERNNLEVLSEFDLHYSGQQRDHFFDFVSSNKWVK